MASFSIAISSTIPLPKPFESPKSHHIKATSLSGRWKPSPYQLRSNWHVLVRPVAAAPEKLEDKLADSIKQAEEMCAGNAAASGECAAAWDEVEELSAAASHARDNKKNTDPLEAFCKDNPEDEECRTYED